MCMGAELNSGWHSLVEGVTGQHYIADRLRLDCHCPNICLIVLGNHWLQAGGMAGAMVVLATGLAGVLGGEGGVKLSSSQSRYKNA